MTSDDPIERFYAGETSEKLIFAINEPVTVVSGEYQGIIGCVIAVQQLEPSVIFVVEDGQTGASFSVTQATLRRLDEQQP